MARKEFPAKVKVAAYERSGGLCEAVHDGQRCNARLTVGKFAYDHVLPDALGGEPVLSNIEAICKPCHAAKTFKQDVPAISRAVRLNKAHVGAKQKSPRPMPGSKASGLRKRMDGTVERRT